MEDIQPISLYLSLRQGEKADLEVVARGALAWAAAMREMAVAIDPWADIRLELSSGTESSLSLNGLLRLVQQALPERVTIRALTYAALLWMGEQGGVWAFNQVLDFVKNHALQSHAALSDEDANIVAKKVIEALQPSVATQAKAQVFIELGRDPVIVGAGISLRHGAQPIYIVPSSQFAERSGTESEAIQDEARRTVTAEMRVILVSPVLKDAERRWRFQQGSMPEFGATMKDHSFLDAMRAGRIDAQLRPGQEMRIVLQTKEELVGGVWSARDRSVIEVLSPHDPLQTSLFPRTPE